MGQLKMGSVLKNLDALAALDAFKEILAEEVMSRNLIMQDVECYIKVLYHELFKHSDGNYGKILIRESDFTPREYAASVLFFKLQDK